MNSETYECKICSGIGMYYILNTKNCTLYTDQKIHSPITYSCLCCKGTGKADWISNIFFDSVIVKGKYDNINVVIFNESKSKY